ncbi:MAG: M67 family metallopeptidase [Gemmataceae bacterium]|nr:M67 family metallopeptidase [Gemmataceae bacterium]
MSTPFQLLLPRQIYDEMVAQAQSEFPNECCGLLAGRIVEGAGRVEVRYPLVNELASPVEYQAAAEGLFRAAKDMRARGIQELAVYHSHPTSAPVPSPADLARNFLGEEVVYLIIGLGDAEPQVRGWWLGATGYREAGWEIID